MLADRAGKVDTPVSRGIGLIGEKGLPEGSGLIIQPCNSVVSFFTRFTIDVVFVDVDSVVCHVMHTMTPWRTSKIVRKSKLVVELPAGTASARTRRSATGSIYRRHKFDQARVPAQ